MALCLCRPVKTFSWPCAEAPRRCAFPAGRRQAPWGLSAHRHVARQGAQEQINVACVGFFCGHDALPRPCCGVAGAPRLLAWREPRCDALGGGAHRSWSTLAV